MNTFGSHHLKAVKLSSMVEDEIKALIVNGQLKEGDRLPNEKELCTKFGVSLITIREALRGLEALGVIEKRRGKDGGVFVSSNSDSIKDAVLTFFKSKQFSFKDVNEVRDHLQPFCARLAAERISDDLMQALEDNVKKCENLLKQNKGKIPKKIYFELKGNNNDFHRLMGVATCNPILALTADYVEDFLKGFKRIKDTPDYGETALKIAQHRKIVECLKTGDHASSENAMMTHLKSMQEFPLEKLKGHVKKLNGG